MVNQQIVSYLKENIAKGYDAIALRNHLIKYGYNARDIDEAITYIYKPPVVRHVVHLSRTSLLAIAIILVAVIVVSSGVFFIAARTAAPKQLLDLEVSSLTDSVAQGSVLRFNVELVNLGASGRYDVNLRYDVISSRTSEIVTYKEETAALETRLSKEGSINIPAGAAAGNYQLRVTANYNSKVASSTVLFDVAKAVMESCSDGIQNQGETGIDCGGSCQACVAASCSDGIQNQDEEGVDCGGPCVACVKAASCSDGIQNQNEEGVDCGGPCAACPSIPEFAGLSLFETLNRIENISYADPSLAASYCRKIEERVRDSCFSNIAPITKDSGNCIEIISNRTRDKCYFSVAKAANISSSCEPILQDSKRDSCYMVFVQSKDYSVCNKLINSWLRQSCDALASVKG